MLYFWLTVFLALVVFIGGLPRMVRRIRVQREALRPVPPITRADHLPCIVNTIGAVLTELSLLGLLTLAVFIGSNAAFGTLGQAPDLGSGIRHVSLGAISVITAISVIAGLLLVGGAFARYALLFIVGLTVVSWMVISSAGDDGLSIILFATLAVGAPTLLIQILRRLF